MNRIERSALLPYPSAQVFALVNDIESYPEYMEGCVGAEILRREGDVIEARLHLSRGGISQSFATRNLAHGVEAIELELVEGPFRHFSGRWQFDALGEAACKVSLDLQFSLNNNLLGAAAARLFDSVTRNLVESLTRRASQLYG